MEWGIAFSEGTWLLGLTILSGTVVLGFLWWALADLVLATFDLGELLERWRRGGPDENTDGKDADTPVVGA